MCSVRENSGRAFSALRSLLAGIAILCGVSAQAMPISAQGTWTTTLLGRDQHGNPVALLSGSNPNPALKYVYDTTLNLTWLANWNVNGLMSWGAANTWAAGLTDFGGGWVLPSVLDIGNDGCNGANSGTDCGYNVYGSEAGRRDSPLAHMYYDTLGNKGFFDASGNFNFLSGWGLTNTGPFSNMQSSVYWSGTAYAPFPAFRVWSFGTNVGDQYYGVQGDGYFAVAVRPGDVFAASVPEPEGLALLGLSFGALAMVRRRRTP